MANEAYFNGKWSLLQWQTKPISMANEAYFVSVTHVVSCLSITYPVSSWKSWWVIDDLAKIYSPLAPFLFLFLFCFNTTCIILFPFALKLLFNLVLVTRVDASLSELRCKDTAFFLTHSELSRRYAKIVEKKLVLSSEMTKINLSMTKMQISVTKIEISVT